MNKGTVILLALVVIVAGVVLYSQTHSVKLGGTTNFNALSVDSVTNAGASTVGTTLQVTGASTLTGGVIIGSNGTAITNRICGSNAAYNPPSLANLASTTQDVTVTGAVAGDTCAAALSSATTSQQMLVGCNVWASGSTTVTIFNLGNTIDYATGTLSVCTIH